MLQADLFTLIIFVIIATIAIYRISFFRTKTVGYFSLLQLIYLVVIPGIGYTLLFSYLQTIIRRPRVEIIIFPDSLLLGCLLLSAMFTYGGIAIHSVTKMIDEYIPHDESLSKKITSYFHLTFSHNLIYSGLAISILCLSLLELNHIPPQNPTRILMAVVKGVIIGASMVVAVFWYQPYGNISRWSDLKTFFLTIWASFVILLYGISKTDPSFREYQLLLPALCIFSFIAILNLFLVLRRVKRGGFRLYFRWGKSKQKLVEVPSSLLNQQSSTK